VVSTFAYSRDTGFKSRWFENIRAMDNWSLTLREEHRLRVFGAHGEVRGAYNLLVGRPEGRRPLGRHMRRWEGNIEMNLGEIGL
jgi:hypothetical protein